MRIFILLLFFTALFVQSHAQTTPDIPPIEDDSIYSSPDIQPEFPGGDAGFYKFIFSHLIYPSAAKDQGIEGTVIVNYVIEKDGSLSNIKIVKGYSLSPSCDQAVIDVLSRSPLYKPGIKDGKPVRVRRFTKIKFSKK